MAIYCDMFYLLEVNEENLASYRSIVGKEYDIFIFFYVMGRYSFYDATQKPNSLLKR